MAVNKNSKKLTAAQLQAMPISIGEARKLLGSEYHDVSDDEIASQILSLNEVAIFLFNNIDLRKMHL